MPFSAECAFCHLTLQSVPDHRLGHSVECPRCHYCFTLAPKSQTEAAATQGPQFGRARIASASPPSAPEPSKVTLSPTGQHSSKSDSITAEKALADTAEKALADPSTQPRLPPIEAQSVRDYFGVGSFGLGSYAFLVAALTHERFLTLGLGLAGLLCGVVGLFLSLSKQQESVLASAGLIVSLPPVLVAVLVPDWLGLHLLGNQPKSVAPSGIAALAPNGRSDFRRAAEGEKLWVDASQDALHLGDVRLRVRSAVVGLVELEPNKGKKTPAVRGLTVGLRLTNAGLTRKISYTGWGGDSPDAKPILRDDNGKSYAPKTFPSGWIVKGRANDAAIPPGKSLDDTLVFEPPPATIRYLHLELPASAAGVNGKLQMELPRAMIVFR